MNLVLAAAPFIRLVGGARGAAALIAGLVIGLLVMRLIAGVYLIPMAEHGARSELRAKYAESAARMTYEAARRSREIEERTKDASDEEIRRLLRGSRR